MSRANFLHYTTVRSENALSTDPLVQAEVLYASGIEPSRANSIVGTMEYMAPEVMVLFGHKILHKDGYTRAIDFWSLGIMIYKLLTGVEPYPALSQDTFAAAFPPHLAKYDSYKEAYVSFFGVVDYSVGSGILNATSRSFIKGLLQFHADNRLGYNVTDIQVGFDALMKHPFFGNINWDLLETKKFPPPYLPNQEMLDLNSNEETDQPKSLCELLVEANKPHWCEEFISASPTNALRQLQVNAKDQHCFSMWYYVGSMIDENQH